MEALLIYLGKVALATGAFYIAYLILFRNRKQFRFNRIYLLSSLVISFLIPLITFTEIREIVYTLQPVPAFTGDESLVAAIAQAPESAWEWHRYLFAFYLAGFAGFLFFLLAGHFRAFEIIRRSIRTILFGTSVHVSAKEIHPFSFFRRIVISKETLPHPNLSIIINHEKIHADENHTLDILASEILFLAQWFNPFAWLLKDEVKNNLEYKTDDQVIKTCNPQTYQLAMVSLADKQGIAPFLTAMNGSQLKNRIVMMKKKTENKYLIVKQLIIIPLLALLVMGLSNKEVETRLVPNSTTENYTIRKGVTGRITDELGKPLAGAEVSVKGREEKTLTDYNGLYELDVENAEAILVFSKPGFAKQEVRVGDKTTIDLQLKENSREGKSGVQFSDVKGMVSHNGDWILSAQKIELRGDNPDKQLILVDGTEVKDFHQINPDSIESVSVLKNESSVAMYGEKGKNGVILINLKKQEKENPVFFIVEDMPEFPGGETGLRKFIAEAINYPIIAQDNGIQGKVYVTFIVGKTGKVRNPKIARGVDPSLDNEALRVVSSLPDWKPGMQRGVPVDVSYTVPVSFVLPEGTHLPASDTLASKKSPVYVVDGKVFTGNIIDIPVDNISSVSVLKDEAAAKFWGGNPKDGVIIINTKTKYNSGTESAPLVLINGLQSDKKMSDIDPNTIESVNILKGETAIKQYGEKGKNGVILIYLKGMADEKYQLYQPNENKGAFFIVEEMPEFPGGETALREFIADAIQYPEIALENRITGKVYVSFIVDKTGKVINPKIARGVDPALDKEALRVVSSLPDWKPGRQKGVPVDVNYTVPVEFKLPAGTTEDRLNSLSDLELRKMIAKGIRYPVTAQEQNLTGKIRLWMEVDENGKISRILDERPAKSIRLDEVVVVGYTGKPSEVKPETTETGMQLLKEEVKRTLNSVNYITDRNLHGRTVEVTVSFLLQ